MNRNHLRAIVRKEFFHILRDPATFIMLTAGPIILIVVFIYTMTADVKDVSLAVINLAQNEQADELIARIDATDEAKIDKHFDSVAEAEKEFDQNKVRAALVIPEHYGELDYYGIPKDLPGMLQMLAGNYDTGNIPQLEIIIDGTEPLSAERVMEGVYNASDAHFREMATKALPAIAPYLEAPVKVKTERRYNPDLRTVVDYYPGMAAFVLALPGIALTLAITGERERGTLENLVATPISKQGLLLGKITPYMVFGVLDALAMVVAGNILYNVPFRGNILEYTFISFFFMMSNMGLGLLISVLVRSQQLAIVIAFLVFFVPSAFFSGIIFPLWAMPQILQLELMMLPAAHYVTVSKAMYLQGASISTLWLNTLALIVLSAAIFMGSVAVFRKKVA